MYPKRKSNFSARPYSRLQNPIVAESENFWLDLEEKGLAFSERVKYLLDPPDPDNLILKNEWVLDVERTRDALDNLKNADRVGCQIMGKVENITVLETVWIRNFVGLGFFPHIIAEKLARYLCLKKVHKQLFGTQ